MFTIQDSTEGRHIRLKVTSTEFTAQNLVNKATSTCSSAENANQGSEFKKRKQKAMSSRALTRDSLAVGDVHVVKGRQQSNGVQNPHLL